MMQKGLSSRERKVALKTFHWFIKESFNPEQWDEKQKRHVLIKGVELPSWKHLTRGGHLNGAPLQRGKWGQRLDHVDKKVGKDLLFRRHGRSERLFVVQRTDTVETVRIKKFIQNVVQILNNSSFDRSVLKKFKILKSPGKPAVFDSN
jgi:hypothetical protein